MASSIPGLGRPSSTAAKMRKPHCLTALAGLVFGLTAGGCSLMGLSDFELAECETDIQCREAFNEGEGFYPQCAAFVCEKVGSSKQCVQLEGEICDGLDNDCDHLVDESEDGEPLLAFAASTLAEEVSAASSATVVQMPDESAHVYFSDGKGGSSVFQVRADPNRINFETLENWAQSEPEDGMEYARSELGTISKGCYRPDGSFGSCEVTKLEVAMGQDVGFFAQTDTQECPGGEIRVGVLDPAFPERLVDRGRGARDPTYRGVATFGSDCTSNFSDACVAAKQNFLAGEAEQEEVDLSCGASGAAIAGIADQALVTFLGLPVSAARCPVDTEVFAMGLLQGRGDLSGDFYWSNPTSDGVPDTLGNTAGGAAPAVLAIADAGFLVGFGSDSGKVRLTWVPRQPPAPKNDGLTCGEEDLLCDDREAFSTAPLLGVLQLGELGSLGQFDGVRLASLELGEGIFALAVTWVEGCVRDADASFDGFAQIAVLEIEEESAQLTPVGDPVSLGPVGRPPMPIASDTPFVTPGFFRTVEGETEDPGDPLAPVPTLESVEGGMGFYVLLGDRRAVRLLVFDGQLLDPEEEIAVPSEARRHLSPDTPGAFLAFDPAGDRIVRAAISCE